MSSFLKATARQRVQAVVDDFRELLAPAPAWASPHLALLNAPLAFDDGIVIGTARLAGQPLLVAAQDGSFMGGAVGEVHGAKLTGLLRRALRDRPAAVLLLAESGGVRLQEANAGLIAVSEIMRALFDVRAAGIPVIALIGGSNGCFGGMGIVVRCCNHVIMSEPARLAMSGPQVIQAAHGVAEWDASDQELSLRTSGGKHRYLLGDCDQLVIDQLAAFRQAASAALDICSRQPAGLSLSALEAEQAKLEQRWQDFSGCREPAEIWQRLGPKE